MKTGIAALTIMLLAGTAQADDFTLIPMSHQIGPTSLDITSKALVTNSKSGDVRLYIGAKRIRPHTTAPSS